MKKNKETKTTLTTDLAVFVHFNCGLLTLHVYTEQMSIRHATMANKSNYSKSELPHFEELATSPAARTKTWNHNMEPGKALLLLLLLQGKNVSQGPGLPR